MPSRKDIEAATPKCPECGVLLEWWHVMELWDCPVCEQARWTAQALRAAQE